MNDFLTKTEAFKLKKIAFPKKVHNVGEFYPEIFDEDEGVEFYEDMEFEAGVFELKSFRLKSNCFPKIKCPVCGKEESIVYSCVASMLSGVHTLKFHCLNCHESFVTRDIDFYHLIRDYIKEFLHNPQPDKVYHCKALRPIRLEFISDEK